MELWIFLCITFLLLLSFFLLHRFKVDADLPPGPRCWPVVGNLFQLGTRPHITLTNLARVHGPLISVRLGSHLMVVASSPAAAELVIKTYDKTFSSRHIPQAIVIPTYIEHSLVWSECTESWHKTKSLCRTQMSSGRALDSNTSHRMQKAEEMVRFLRSKPDGTVFDLAHLAFGVVFNIISNMVFSRDMFEVGSTDMNELVRIFQELMHYAVAANADDFFPFLRGWDLQGLNRSVAYNTKRIYDTLDGYIMERKESNKSEGDHADLLDVMISNGFGEFEMKALLQEMFVAGTNTTTALIEWAMAELIKSPNTMAKLRKELTEAFRSKDDQQVIIDESRFRNLPYLQACIKEALRLHPSTPLMVPHRALERTQLMG